MNGKINSYSKEVIKARMLQNAVKIWGLKNISSIDPFVKMLIDAFSTEIFNVNNEIQAINTRILEKLAKLLTPSIYTYPQPAHAIGIVLPYESQEILPDYTEFFLRRQFSSSVKSVSDVQMDMPFTPIDNISLVKMEVNLLFAGNTCFAIDKDYSKIPVAKIPPQIFPENKIVIGIDAENYENENLPATLSFYCANPTFEYIHFVFKLLPFAEVKSKNKILKVRQGLTYAENTPASGYEEIFKEYSIRTRIAENIKDIYKDKFIEISGIGADVVTKELPESLAFAEGIPEIKNIISGKPMIWLELEFPPQYTPEILENFSFTLNAFPVYNREWRSNGSSPDIMDNNIPLSTKAGEHFLYVENVTDSHGYKYREIPFSQSGDLQKGLYTVRKGGMERFSERDAVDMIAGVLELTRDEVSSFGILEHDKVAKALQNMTSQMKILEQKVDNASRNIMEGINYVIVDITGNVDSLHADYWVTQCTSANNIRTGTKLFRQKIGQSDFVGDMILLTDSTGGSNEQNGTDAIQAYKYALTTRDKIISVEDIKNFCRLTLKGDLKEIEIKRGTIVSDKPKEGFIRTIEIEIAPASYSTYGKAYWDNMSVSLKNRILARAIDGIEYIVKILNKDDAQ